MTSESATNPTEGCAPPHSTDMVRLESVVVAFGGLQALGGVDLTVAAGERLAVLGPNGAGKTTLFNVVAGDVKPTSGRVRIKGVDCTHIPPRFRPRLGVSRTYQKSRLFRGLTVEDNLYLALVGKTGRHRAITRRVVDAELRERARAMAEVVWLGDSADEVAGNLSHGRQRQLEIGIAMVTEPDFMMLDEPASGLSRGERERLVDLLDNLDPAMTLLLIEHDMDVALKVARRVVVMSDGLTVAGGTPEQVRADPLVRAIYLGSGDDHSPGDGALPDETAELAP